MIFSLLLCLFCFFIGSVSRFCFVGLTLAERRIKLKAITFLFDFVWGVLTVAALMCVILIFNNGVTMPYMLIAALIGFSVTAIFV